MKKESFLVFILLIASILLQACGSSQDDVDAQATEVAADIFATQTAEAPNAQATEIAAEIFATQTAEASGPAEGAQEWIDGLVNQDGNKTLKHTCLAQRENLEEATMWAAAFNVLTNFLSRDSIQVKGDISDLHFETINQSGDQAEVRVFGELRIAVSSKAEAHQVDERWQMVRENETWRWCGSNPVAEKASTSDATESSTAQEPNLGQSPYRLVGYDLRQTETKDDWTTYTVSLGIENVSDKEIRGPRIPIIDAYVEILNGETYPAELQLSTRFIYSNLITPPTIESKDTIESSQFDILAPSALILDSMRYLPGSTGTIFGPGGIWSIWQLSFKVPENDPPNKLVIPEIADLELVNVVARKDIKLPDLTSDQGMPISFMANDSVEVTISNPRLTEDSEYGKMFVFDMNLENKDTSQSNTVSYDFTLVDLRGTWLKFYTTDCLIKKDRTDALPLLEIELDPGEKASGYVCNLLNPGGYLEDSQMRVLDTTEELDPRELGLDPDNIMQVKGIEGTFTELRYGFEMPDGKFIQWVGNKRLGKIIIQERGQQVSLPPLLSDTYLLYIRVGENWHSQAIRLND